MPNGESDCTDLNRMSTGKTRTNGKIYLVRCERVEGMIRLGWLGPVEVCSDKGKRDWCHGGMSRLKGHWKKRIWELDRRLFIGHMSGTLRGVR